MAEKNCRGLPHRLSESLDVGRGVGLILGEVVVLFVDEFEATACFFSRNHCCETTHPQADGAYGWKHDFIPLHWDRRSRDRMVCVLRSAATWLPKMRRAFRAARREVPRRASGGGPRRSYNARLDSMAANVDLARFASLPVRV